MALIAHIGRCLLFFFVAVLLDVAGLLIFLIGVFAPLSYWEFFVFSGTVIVFLSLVFWIFWYLGSLEVSLEELRLR